MVRNCRKPLDSETGPQLTASKKMFVLQRQRTEFFPQPVSSKECSELQGKYSLANIFTASCETLQRESTKAVPKLPDPRSCDTTNAYPFKLLSLCCYSGNRKAAQCSNQARSDFVEMRRKRNWMRKREEGWASFLGRQHEYGGKSSVGGVRSSNLWTQSCLRRSTKLQENYCPLWTSTGLLIIQWTLGSDFHSFT